MSKFVFETKLRAVSTVFNGRPVEIEKGQSYTTTDEDEASVLRQIDGIKEVSSEKRSD